MCFNSGPTVSGVKNPLCKTNQENIFQWPDDIIGTAVDQRGKRQSLMVMNGGDLCSKMDHI